MGTLITLLGTGKGTWHEVHGLLSLKAFDTVLVFIDEWAAKDYRNEHGAALAVMPADAPSATLVTLFSESIKQKLQETGAHAEFDIALNIASGTGKQHAALIAAVLQLGYGVRFVTYENNELKVLL